MSFNFVTFPILKTERLILRALNFDDIEAVFDLRSNEEVHKLITRKTPKNLKEAEDFIKVCHEEFENRNRVFWAMEFNDKMIGTIVYHRIDLDRNYAEIGYELNPEYHQKGFMSEAMKSVLNYGFSEMNLNIVEAFTHKNNTPSIALLEKCNFIFQPERKCKNVENNSIYKLYKV